MERAGPPPRSSSRLFLRHAALSLVPVVALGAILAWSYRSEAHRRGLAEGRSEAALVATTAIQPQLDGRPLAQGLTKEEEQELGQVAATAVRKGDLLRLRLRDLHGQVVFSDDGSGFSQRPEDEALDAAHGSVVALLTRVNADANDSGSAGVAAVEVYRELLSPSGQPVGVLEVYLPYAPINADVTAGLHHLYVDLSVGLLVLYGVLFLISLSVSRGLRREVKRNAYLAEHDALTGLPNRTRFQREATRMLRKPDARGAPVTVAIADLDRFKDVNDSLGHHNGDQLLSEIARRLAEHVGDRGIVVARLGGDEFGIVLSNARDPEAVLARVREVIAEEVPLSGLPVTVGASIGYAVAPDHGGTVEDLLQRADVALYVAKATHGGVLRYDPVQDTYDAANLALIAELRPAISTGQLRLHYQPKVRLDDGSMEAMEALIRWDHPEHGLIPPDRFVPLAEQTDLIHALTSWALERALAELKALGPSFAHVSVAVNVSARSLADLHFPAQVQRTLSTVGLPADRLILEITETALVSDPNRAASVIRQLTGLGVRTSLDDFGQGQTSLAFLSSLPIHELKIDKGFVVDMTESPAHAAIVRAIIDLGHTLGFRITAEGVETDDVRQRLRDAGCDVIQGYLLSRPLPANDLAGWLADPMRGLAAATRGS